jgi:tripartite-type tricarboxylate transporter receptor subunit TctC
VAAATLACAQEGAKFPSGPIRFVIPTPPGGGNDIVARLIGDKLSAAWGQPVIVESKPGASGLIAAAAVAKAPADGYTLLLTHAALTTSVALRPNPPVRMNELTAVSQIVVTPIAFTVSANTGAKNLSEFVAAAKANPKKFSFGSYGTGTSAHLLGEMLNRRAGIDLLHVPYKGEAPAISDLLGGQVTAVFGSAGTVAPHAKAGKVRIVAFASPRRVASFPDVPTFTEAGYAELNLPGWIGVLAPAATPKPIVTRLAREIARITHLPDVAPKLIEVGYEPTGTDEQAFSDLLGQEVKKWAAVGKELNISLD